MNRQQAYDLLVDHNCAGPCSCDDCKEAKRVIEEAQRADAAQIIPILKEVQIMAAELGEAVFTMERLIMGNHAGQNSGDWRRAYDKVSRMEPKLRDALSKIALWSAPDPEELDLRKRAEKAEAELSNIDALLARRAALDGIPNRFQKIQHALEVAGQVQHK